MRLLPLLLILVACPRTAQPEPATPERADRPPAAAPTALPPEPLAPQVVDLEEAPVRVNPPGSARVQGLVEGRNAWMGVLRLEPGAAVPEHRDETEEYLYVLEGSGEITIDGRTWRISPGSAVFMPANALVSFQNDDAPLVVVQVFAGPEPARKFDAWALEPDAEP